MYDPARPLIIVDGDCALCGWSARLVSRADKACEIQIAPIKSPLGQRLCLSAGVNPNDPETWLYVEDRVAFTSLHGVARLGQRLGGWMQLLVIFRILPRRTQDWLYRWVASNRIKWFGRSDICALPDQRLRQRLVTE